MFELRAYMLNLSGQYECLWGVNGESLSQAATSYYDWDYDFECYTPQQSAEYFRVEHDGAVVLSPSGNARWSVDEIKSKRN